MYYLQKYPTCFSPTLNTYFIEGKLTCTRLSATQIEVDGATGIIYSGLNYRIQFSMQNPPYVINPDTYGSQYVFSMKIYKYGTQILYESFDSIPGPTISAAGLNSVSLTQTDTVNLNNRYKFAEYELKFTPTMILSYGKNSVYIISKNYFSSKSYYHIQLN